MINSTDVINCPFSDHSFLVASLRLKSKTSDVSVVESRRLNPDKLDLIDDCLSQTPFHLIDSVEDSDDKFFIFIKLINDVLNEIAPIRSIRVKKNHLPWVDSEMKKLFIIRDKIYSTDQLYDKSHSIWFEFKIIRNRCKSMLRQKMKNYYINKTSSKMGDSKKFWNFYKSVIKTKKSTEVQSISNIQDENGILKSNHLDIANVFN